MDTTKDMLSSRWGELKDQVKKKWGKLTDDDLAQVNGKTEELVAFLQQRYGYGKVQAEIEIRNWLHNLESSRRE